MQETRLDCESFAEHSPDGIFITQKQRIVYANRSIAEILGYTPDELLGMKLDSIIIPDQNGKNRNLRKYGNVAPFDQCEMHFRRRDNSQRTVESTATPADWHGNQAIVHIVRDITERKRKETALRDIESQFLQLTNNINEVFFVRELQENRIVYISPAYEKIWRRPVSDMYHNSLAFMEYIHPADKEHIQAIIRDRDKHRRGFSTYHYRIVWPNGEVRWIRARTFPIVDETGRPYRVAGIAEDITAEKIAEEKLRLSEMQLRQIIDLVPLIIFVKDNEGRILLANKATADFYGTTVNKLTGAFLQDLHLSKDRVDRILADIQEVLDTNHPKLSQNGDFVDAAGRHHILNTIKIPFVSFEEGQKAVLGVAIDDTDRKRAEAALRESEERLRHSLHYANIGTWDWNIQTGVIFWSENVAPLFGQQPGPIEISYDAFLAALHPDDRQFVESAVQSSIETGRDYDIEHRVVWPDHSIHWVHETGGVVYNTDGRPERMLGVVSDITRRKLAEQSLMQSEKKYRAVMENASDAILLGTMDTRIIDANHRAEELFGYTRDELLQLNGKAIHPREDHSNLARALNNLAIKGSSLSEHLGLRKDGSTFNVEVAATLIDYQGEKVMMGIFRDTTARKHAEEERLEHARAHRDTLVREVHHRIKNNLQGVVGLLRQHATRHPELRGPLESAIGQVNSVSVVHGLYGRSSGDHIVLCEMTEAICQSTGGLLGKKIDPHLTVNVDSPVRISNDEAVPLALILNELIFNAVKHQVTDSEPVQVHVQDEPNGARVRIITPGTNLPQGFDFSSESGLGTGLKLVKSLLPPNGCQLHMDNEDMNVITELLLSIPVIAPSSIS